MVKIYQNIYKQLALPVLVAIFLRWDKFHQTQKPSISVQSIGLFP